MPDKFTAGPGAVLTLCNGAAIFETHSDALGVRRDDAEFDPAFRVHLRVFLTLLVGRGRFPVIDRRVILGRTELAGYNRSEGKEG